MPLLIVLKFHQYLPSLFGNELLYSFPVIRLIQTSEFFSSSVWTQKNLLTLIYFLINLLKVLALSMH